MDVTDTALAIVLVHARRVCARDISSFYRVLSEVRFLQSLKSSKKEID